jgi:hypothetical protein
VPELGEAQEPAECGVEGRQTEARFAGIPLASYYIIEKVWKLTARRE